MIIDTSAIVAILRADPDAEVFARAIEEARTRRISAVSFVETAAVTDGSRDAVASRRLDELFREAELTIEDGLTWQAGRKSLVVSFTNQPHLCSAHRAVKHCGLFHRVQALLVMPKVLMIAETAAQSRRYKYRA